MMTFPVIKKGVISLHRANVNSQIEATPESQLLQISKEEYEQIKREKRETLIHGNHYDFVRSKIVNGVEYALLWEDKHETNLFSFFKNIAKSTNSGVVVHFLYLFSAIALIVSVLFNNWSRLHLSVFFYKKGKGILHLHKKFQPPKRVVHL